MEGEVSAAVVPVFNPEHGLYDLCESLCRKFAVVVVLDDGSLQNRDAFSNLPAKCEIVRHDVNMGKGRAIKSAIGYLRRHHPGVSVMVCCDGDGQHGPDDVSKVAARSRQLDCVTFGVRDFSSSGIPLRSRFGNVLTSFLVRLVFRFPLRDTQTGLRAIPARLFEVFEALPGERYEYEMRYFALLKSLGERLEQVPIKTIYIEGNRTSHFRPIVDSVRVYYGLFGGAFIRFCASSVFGFLVDNLVFTTILFALQSVDLSRRYAILASLAVARFVSATANYLANRIFVFESNGEAFRSYLKYWVLVVLIGMMSYTLTSLSSAVCDAKGWAITTIKIVVESGLFLVSYKLQKRWVFSNK